MAAASRQQHLDPLSALDAAFLLQESPTTHMHTGSVSIFRGTPPGYEEFLAHVRGRLDRVPRYRQKLAYPPGGIGLPRWVDDPTFNLDYHVRIARLPEPGSDEQLRYLAARLFSIRLDRNRPLWELLLIEGLNDDRFVLLAKTHHAVVDGITGIDITTALFDAQPDPRPPTATANGSVSAEPPLPWIARPEPSSAQLAAAALSGGARDVARLPVHVLGAVADRARLRSAARGFADTALTALRAAPESPLNVRIGPHRRVAFVDARLDDFKLVKNAFGGTVNDVLLAVVAGALRLWLHERGLRTEGLELRAAVPVSTRGSGDADALGNQVTQLIAPLPVDVADPVARLRLIHEEMDHLTRSREALGAEVIASAEEFAPPTILARATRLNFSTRAYNLLVTNIPGPQIPLYLLGRRLDEIFPLAFLAGDRALAVAAMSYDGTVGFGLIGDFDELADIEVIARGLRGSLQQLVRLAERRGRRTGRSSAAR